MQKSYNKTAVVLHAVQGFLIAFILVTGSFVLSEMPETVEKLGNYKIHTLIGVGILLLTFIRYFVVKNQSVEPLEMAPIREKIMKLNHKLIYIVLVLVSLSGIVLLKGTGLMDMIFFSQSYMPVDLDDMPMAEIHESLTSILIFLVAMHLFGVFSYNLKSKQNILKRVWFSKK